MRRAFECRPMMRVHFLKQITRDHFDFEKVQSCLCGGLSLPLYYKTRNDAFGHRSRSVRRDHRVLGPKGDRRLVGRTVQRHSAAALALAQCVAHRGDRRHLVNE
jgi:hypothetical protein